MVAPMKTFDSLPKMMSASLFSSLCSPQTQMGGSCAFAPRIFSGMQPGLKVPPLIPAPGEDARIGRLRAFTLVELLVVIAVIAILAAVLIPATSKMGKRGMRVQTVANLRAVGLAFQTYVSDHNNMMPIGYQAPDPDLGRPGGDWRQALVDGNYLGTKDKPASPTGSYSYEFSVLGSPLQIRNNPLQPKWDWRTFSANAYVMGANAVGQTVSNQANLLKFQYPTQTVLISEGATQGAERFNTCFYSSAATLPNWLEGGQVSCLFLDLHVETMPLANWPQYSTVAGSEGRKFWIGFEL